MKRKLLVSVLSVLGLSLGLIGCQKTDTSSTNPSSKTPSGSNTPEKPSGETSNPDTSKPDSSTPGSSSPDSSTPDTPEPDVPDTPEPAVKLQTPTLTLNDDKNGLVVSSVEHATKYQVQVNDQAWADATTHAFLTEAGQYTIKARAIGDGTNYTDSDSVSYTYTVKLTDIVVTKDGPTHASWTYVGLSLEKDGTTTTDTEYTATQSGSITLVAKAGYDEQNHIYYPSDKTKEVSFAVVGANSYVIENGTDKDGNNKADADLADEWTVKKFESSWVDTSASVKVGKGYDNTNCIVLNSWNNSNSFRFSKSIDVKDAYNVLKLSVKSDNITNLKIRLKNSSSGVYATFDLDTVTNNWNDYTIAMNDENLKVTFNGKDYGIDTVLSMMGKADASELVSYFDTFEILQKGNTPNGASTKIYLDNIVFDNVASPTTGYVAHVDNVKTLYVSEVNQVKVKFAVTGDGTGTLETLNYKDVDTTKTDELNIPVTFAIENDVVRITSTEAGDTVAGALVSVEGKLINSGATFKVTSATGQVGTLLTGATFAYAANVNFDFESEATPPSDYAHKSKGWIVEKYQNSGWTELTSTQMRIRNENGSTTNKVVNMATSKSAAKYTYNKDGESLGLANYVSVDLGNWYSGAAEMSIKLSLIDTAGTTHYLIGDSSTWGKLPVNTKLERKSQLLDAPVEIKSIVFATQSTLSSAYLYVDNIVADFRARAPEVPDEPEPEPGPVVANANINLDFESLTAAQDYTGTDWTKEKYTTEWTSGGTIRVRKDPTNATNVLNFANGYGTTYNYTYIGDNSGLGLANHFSVKLGNWWTGAEVIKYKISVIDTSNTKHYLKGDANSFVDLAVTTGLEQIEVTSPTDINVKSIVFTTKSSKNGDAFFYIDDLVLNHISQ